ncbi:hypothetical protein HJFPF1_01561 [Paramyrothecium foliicola]|nr:hypothetical protein HJFPF1_01561 [Paramyrothecium foliicola]
MNGRPGIFRETLAAVSAKVVFVCPTTISLANFAEKISPYYAYDPSLMPKMRLEVSLFKSHEMEAAPALSLYRQTPMYHGYEEKAYEHVKDKMAALNLLSSYLQVDIVMERPWREYRALRYSTSPLRQKYAR